jgi:hypothetical protein
MDWTISYFKFQEKIWRNRSRNAAAASPGHICYALQQAAMYREFWVSEVQKFRSSSRCYLDLAVRRFSYEIQLSCSRRRNDSNTMQYIFSRLMQRCYLLARLPWPTRNVLPKAFVPLLTRRNLRLQPFDPPSQSRDCHLIIDNPR